VNSQIISDTVILHGTVSDQADWAGEVAYYAFEEAAGSPIFYDSSEYGVHLNCANCPTVAGSGPFGQSLDFDGLDDLLTTYTGTNTLFDRNELTLSAWIRPDTTEGVDRIITMGNGAGGLYIGIFGELSFDLAVDGLPYTVEAAGVLTAGEWQHIAGTYDGQTMRLYHKGIEVGKLDIAGNLDQTAGPLEGMFLGGVAEPYDGQIDEVGVYQRALSDAEIYAVAQDTGTGVQNVQVGLEIADFLGIFNEPQITWYPATFNNATWSYPIPAFLEGMYNLHLRSTDNFGNISQAQLIWRGVLDVQPPLVSASGQHFGSGSTAETEYTFTFGDFLLDDNSYVQPCAAGELVSSNYNEPALPHHGLPFYVTATCRVPGHETSRDFTACDGVGHCTTQTVTLEPPPPLRDIQLLDFMADGHTTLTVTYQILTNTVSPFAISFYTSTDTLYDGGVSLLSSVSFIDR
jgi:hypothetical protein